MKFVEFLIEAKKNTYAKKGESKEIIFDDGSKGFVYEKENFKYIDKYFGYDPFMGREIVLRDGEIIWGMNYYGETFVPIVNEVLSEDERISHSDVYDFLKKCLREVNEKAPFRGPKRFEDNDFLYINKYAGDIADFEGKEEIYKKTSIPTKAYTLLYHGGFIEEKRSKL